MAEKMKLTFEERHNEVLGYSYYNLNEAYFHHYLSNNFCNILQNGYNNYLCHKIFLLINLV